MVPVEIIPLCFQSAPYCRLDFTLNHLSIMLKEIPFDLLCMYIVDIDDFNY